MDLILFLNKAISSLIQLSVSLLHFNTKLSVAPLCFEYEAISFFFTLKAIAGAFFR